MSQPRSWAGSCCPADHPRIAAPILVTDRNVEVWSAEPAQGWDNPSLIQRDKVTNIQYLG